MPGDVLLIEGLDLAHDSTRPARIVRWVVPHESKPKPAPRAPVFGFELRRFALIGRGNT